MKRKSATVLLAGFVLALALLGGVAWLDWRYVVRSEASAELVARTQEVQSNLNRLLVQLLDIETGMRGFVMTGDPVFLEPFVSGLKSISGQQHKLAQLIVDAAQKASLTALVPEIAERIALSRHNAMIYGRERSQGTQRRSGNQSYAFGPTSQPSRVFCLSFALFAFFRG